MLPFALVGVMTACEPDEIIETDAIPTAGVRFIHAVPDTTAMDFRFVDIVESNAHWAVGFRSGPLISGGVPASTLVQYKNARAGSRQFRIFLNPNCSPASCNQSIATTVIKDTTVTLQDRGLYTALLWGYANPTGAGRPAGALPMRLTFVEEVVADPGSQVGLRVINAHNAAVDVRYYRSTGGTAPGTDLALNVAPLSITTHVNVDTTRYSFNVRPAGGATTLFADRVALPGELAVVGPPGPIEALPGTRVSGSAVTAIIFPPSVAGTGAPQGAGSATVPSWTAPAITFIWDRRPPRAPGT